MLRFVFPRRLLFQFTKFLFFYHWRVKDFSFRQRGFVLENKKAIHKICDKQSADWTTILLSREKRSSIRMSSKRLFWIYWVKFFFPLNPSCLSHWLKVAKSCIRARVVYPSIPMEPRFVSRGYSFWSDPGFFRQCFTFELRPYFFPRANRREQL